MKIGLIKRLLYVFGVKGVIDLVGFKLNDRTPSENPCRIYVKKFHRNIFIRHGTSDFGLLRDFFWTDVSNGKELLYDVDYLDEVSFKGDIIDAGANIGLFTLLVANKYPNARIIAIEPEDHNYEILRMNTEGIANVKTYKSAVWYKEAYLNVTTTELSSGTVGYVVEECTDRIGDLHAYSIEDFIDREGINRLGILKMDIEGSEYEIFLNERYAAWIDKADMIMMETHDIYHPGLSEMIKKIMINEGFVVSQHSEDFVFRRVYVK